MEKEPYYRIKLVRPLELSAGVRVESVPRNHIAGDQIWNVNLLDVDAHPTLRDTSPTPDLHRVVRNLAGRLGEEQLEERDGPRKALRLLFVGHRAPVWMGWLVVGPLEEEESESNGAHIW